MQEQELIKRCRKNDRKAQNLLFNQFEKRVLSFCARYTGSWDEARDLQQETFIKIFETLSDRQTEIQSLERWITRIAINTSIDYFRKQRRIEASTENVSESIPEKYTVLEKLDEEELIKMIQGIPSPYRMVFNLFIIEGYSHSEIGKLMEITESTSRSYLTRARDYLRSKLGQPEIKKSYG